MQNPNPVAATFRDEHKNCVRSCCCILGCSDVNRRRRGVRGRAWELLGHRVLLGSQGMLYRSEVVSC